MTIKSLSRRPFWLPPVRLSRTAFVPMKVQLAIIESMEKAHLQRHSDYIENRKGSLWLRVVVKQDRSGLRYFEFRGRDGLSVGHVLRKAVLASWEPALRARFIDLEQEILPRGDKRLYAA